jgi:hypothetical protein
MFAFRAMDFLRMRYENAIQEFLEIPSICYYFFSDQRGTIDRACQIENDETYSIIADGSSVPLFYQVSLNDLIFHILQDFLNDTNTGSTKKMHFYWKLKKVYSLTYLYSPQYRERTSLRTNINTCLSLNLSNCFQIVDLTALENVHDVNISGCGLLVDISPLHRAHTVDLSRCWSVANVSALGNVHSLTLLDYKAGTRWGDWARWRDRVIDLTPLCNVSKLHLRGLFNFRRGYRLVYLDCNRNKSWIINCMDLDYTDEGLGSSMALDGTYRIERM